MTTASRKPIVLIPANIIDYTGLDGHVARGTYIRALVEAAGCVPLILPAVGNAIAFDDIKGRFDGILLTGARSNLDPVHYGAVRTFDAQDLDLARDSTTLPLIREAVTRDIPMLAVCRGLQELNVACGGTLHQKVHELPGMLDHRKADGPSLKKVYEMKAHEVRTEKGGWFERIDLPETFMVNTLHQQGIDKLGSGLHVECRAPDGLVEAISIPGKRFILATQWHPEGDFEMNPVSQKIFAAFGQALRG